MKCATLGVAQKWTTHACNSPFAISSTFCVRYLMWARARAVRVRVRVHTPFRCLGFQTQSTFSARHLRHFLYSHPLVPFCVSCGWRMEFGQGVVEVTRGCHKNGKKDRQRYLREIGIKPEHAATHSFTSSATSHPVTSSHHLRRTEPEPPCDTSSLFYFLSHTRAHYAIRTSDCWK